MVTRNATRALDVVKQGLWPSAGWSPFGFCGPHLGLGPNPAPEREYTVGFLGFGRISQATLHRLVPFGITRALYVNSGMRASRVEQDEELVEKYKGNGSLKQVKRVSIEKLAAESDIIFLLIPG